MSELGAGEGDDGTASDAYAQRLLRLSAAPWKKILHVQAPYHWNIRRMRLGRAIDVGCGLGRNLEVLDEGSIGVDHNPHLVAAARSRGLAAYTVDEFFTSPELTGRADYDAILVAHVVEHLSPDEARDILSRYLPLVRPGGKVAFITPQERGFASDPTHVSFTGFAELEALCRDLGLEIEREYSFPLPRAFGRAFAYNEFVVTARVPSVG